MHILNSAFTSGFAHRKLKVNCQWNGWQECEEDSHVFRPNSLKESVKSYKTGWFSHLDLALLFLSSLVITEMHMFVIASFWTPVYFHSPVVPRNVIFSCKISPCEICIQAYHSNSEEDSWQTRFFWSNYHGCPCKSVPASVPQCGTFHNLAVFLPEQKELVIFPFLVLLFSVLAARHFVWLNHWHGFHFLWGGLMRHAANPWNEVCFLTEQRLDLFLAWEPWELVMVCRTNSKSPKN